MYKNPTPTVDIIIIKDDQILLIERHNEPFGWALPGGFVDEGEWIEGAAIREAYEETGLEIELEQLFYVYSDPQRDARLHTLSTVFIASTSGAPRAGDDAKDARFYAFDALPSPLCFDHALIIEDFLHYRRTGELRPLRRYISEHGAA